MIGASHESTTRPQQRVAVFGATSDIALAYARRRAKVGASLVLLGRDRTVLEAAAGELVILGAAEVLVETIDFYDLPALPKAVDSAWAAFGGVDVALLAFGMLPNQTLTEGDPAAAAQALTINFVSPCLLCVLLASKLEAQRFGTLAAITSVAGDRGRKVNYVYGAAKGGLQRLLEGLRERLRAANVHVLDIRPGLVATKMTGHASPPGRLWVGTAQVAADIEGAVRGNRGVLYTPWFWRYIMMAIRNLPVAFLQWASL